MVDLSFPNLGNGDDPHSSSPIRDSFLWRLSADLGLVDPSCRGSEDSDQGRSAAPGGTTTELTEAPTRTDSRGPRTRRQPISRPGTAVGRRA